MAPLIATVCIVLMVATLSVYGPQAQPRRASAIRPDSELSRWFRARVGDQKGRVRRIAIVALARKLMVALWRYVTTGLVPTGAVLKPAI